MKTAEEPLLVGIKYGKKKQWGKMLELKEPGVFSLSSTEALTQFPKILPEKAEFKVNRSLNVLMKYQFSFR